MEDLPIIRLRTPREILKRTSLGLSGSGWRKEAVVRGEEEAATSGRGSSDFCETFSSRMLSGEKVFDVVDIEVWGFGQLSSLRGEVRRMIPRRSLAQSLSNNHDYDSKVDAFD